MNILKIRTVTVVDNKVSSMGIMDVDSNITRSVDSILIMFFNGSAMRSVPKGIAYRYCSKQLVDGKVYN